MAVGSIGQSTGSCLGVAMSLSFQMNSLPRVAALSAATDFARISSDHGACGLFTNASPSKSAEGARALVDERARIAQELHDTLLQGFLAASMQLHATLDGLSEDCPQKQQFESVARLVDRALEEGRCALQGLQSSHSHAGSLGEAFARVPRDLGLPSGTGFRVVVLGTERKLRTGLLDEIYRIGREAIVNACRHSRAKDIEAQVEYRASELRIAVRDNGCGMGSRELATEPAGHWGLRGMRERAEKIGARLHLWSAPAVGTEVELCVPGKVAFEQASSALSFLGLASLSFRPLKAMSLRKAP
jgi:signal transduction histidine kinase